MSNQFSRQITRCNRKNISAISSQMLELLNALTAEEKQSALRLIYNSLTERKTQIKEEQNVASDVSAKFA